MSAESNHKHEENKEDVYFCEFGAKTRPRRLALPALVNVAKVTANLDVGMLCTVAQKSEKALHAQSAAA